MQVVRGFSLSRKPRTGGRCPTASDPGRCRNPAGKSQDSRMGLHHPRSRRTRHSHRLVLSGGNSPQRATHRSPAFSITFFSTSAQRQAFPKSPLNYLLLLNYIFSLPHKTPLRLCAFHKNI